MQKILTVIGVLMSLHLSTVVSSLSLSFSPIVIEGEYKKEYQLIINNTVEYVFLYPTNNVSIVLSKLVLMEFSVFSIYYISFFLLLGNCYGNCKIRS